MSEDDLEVARWFMAFVLIEVTFWTTLVVRLVVR